MDDVTALGAEPRSRSSWSTGRELGFCAALLALAAVSRAEILHLVPIGQMNDDASYLLRAMKLARPAEFAALRDATHYPIGWPLVLAPLLAIATPFLMAGRFLTTLLTCLTAVILYLTFQRRSGSRPFAVGVALLFLHSPSVMIFGSSLMSEPLYFFLLSCGFLLAGYANLPWQFGLLGLTAGWCVATRSEGVVAVAVIAIALSARSGKPWKALTPFLGGFLCCVTALRLVAANSSESSRTATALSYFSKRSLEETIFYPATYVWSNGMVSLGSVLGLTTPAGWLIWGIALAAALRLTVRAGLAQSARDFSRDAAVMWVLAFPIALAAWPYFNPRYWPLWTVMALSMSLLCLPVRFRLVGLAALLAIQFPAAWQQYTTGPLARRFEQELYLPYYRTLAEARRVLTLNWSRVEVLAQVPTAQPLMRPDFQSLPIAMAHQGCDLIEWEVTDRNLTSTFGDKARIYPPQALEGLRRSSLFQKHSASAFSESFRLLADPERLKLAGQKYSQAMQEKNPETQIALLEQALSLVPDLPETRLSLLQLRLARNPNDGSASTDLGKLLEQYPFLAP